MIKSKKEKVLIYAVFNENNIDNGLKKEELIKKYCKDKGYDIVEIVREPLPYTFFQIVDDFVNIMKKYLSSNGKLNFDKVLVYDIRDIVPNNSSLLTLLTILKEDRKSLESIMQGKLNFNPLDKEDILGDDFVFEHYTCHKNEKYFLDNPF